MVGRWQMIVYLFVFKLSVGASNDMPTGAGFAADPAHQQQQLQNFNVPFTYSLLAHNDPMPYYGNVTNTYNMAAQPPLHLGTTLTQPTSQPQPVAFNLHTNTGNVMFHLNGLNPQYAPLTAQQPLPPFGNFLAQPYSQPLYTPMLTNPAASLPWQPYLPPPPAHTQPLPPTTINATQAPLPAAKPSDNTTSNDTGLQVPNELINTVDAMNNRILAQLKNEISQVRISNEHISHESTKQMYAHFITFPVPQMAVYLPSDTAQLPCTSQAAHSYLGMPSTVIRAPVTLSNCALHTFITPTISNKPPYEYTLADVMDPSTWAMFQHLGSYMTYCAYNIGGARQVTLINHWLAITAALEHRKYRSETITAATNPLDFFFNYNSVDPGIDQDLATCLIIQLLIAGLYDHIPARLARCMRHISHLDTAILLCHMLSVATIDQFARFATVLHGLVVSDGDASAQSSTLTEIHRMVLANINPAMATLYRANLSQQAEKLMGMMRAVKPDLEAFVQGRHSGSGLSESIAPKVSFFWHAAVMTAQIRLLEHSDNHKGTEVVSMARQQRLVAQTMELLDLLSLCVGQTASWPCWRAVTGVISHIIPALTTAAYVIVRTPPAFASELIIGNLFAKNMCQTFLAFWVGLQTWHLDNILDNFCNVFRNIHYSFAYHLFSVAPAYLITRIPDEQAIRIFNFILRSENEDICNYTQAKAGTERADAATTAERPTQSDRTDVSDEECQNILARIADLQKKNTQTATTTAQTDSAEPFSKKRRTCTDFVAVYSNKESSGEPHNNMLERYRQPSSLLWLILLTRKSVTDIPMECIHSIACDTKHVHTLSLVIYDMLTEEPCMRSLLKLKYFSDKPWTFTSLLELFGTHREETGKAANLKPKKATKALGASSAATAKKPSDTASSEFDVVWDRCKKSRHLLRRVPSIFFKDLLPIFIDLIVPNMYNLGYYRYIELLDFLMSEEGFKASMEQMHHAIADILLALPDSTDSEVVAPPSKITYVSLRACPAKRMPLADLEAAIRAQRPDFPFSVESYTRNALAMERLALSLLSNTDLDVQVSYATPMIGRLLERLVAFNLCTFWVGGTEESPEMGNAFYKELGLPRMRDATASDAALEGVGSIQSDPRGKVVLKLICYHCIHIYVHTSKENISEREGRLVLLWGRILRWFFTHACLQRYFGLSSSGEAAMDGVAAFASAGVVGGAGPSGGSESSVQAREGECVEPGVDNSLAAHLKCLAEHLYNMEATVILDANDIIGVEKQLYKILECLGDSQDMQLGRLGHLSILNARLSGRFNGYNTARRQRKAPEQAAPQSKSRKARS